jgi:hypothetical protein
VNFEKVEVVGLVDSAVPAVIHRRKLLGGGGIVGHDPLTEKSGARKRLRMHYA